MTNRNQIIKNRTLSAVAADDWVVLGEVLHPSIVIKEPNGLPFAGEYRGLDGYRTLIDRLHKTIKIDSITELGDFFSQNEDEIVFLIRITGSTLKSGALFDTRVLEYWRFSGGKVVEMCPLWFDTPDPEK